MKQIIKRCLLVSALCALIPVAAYALSLDEAKSNGMVGEKGDGYLGAVAAAPSAEVEALVGDINGKRRAKYLEIAKQNGTEPRSVESIAGKKAIENTPAGQFVMGAGGWAKK
jgi:uncharacterized protein YdbL (DUF1318 family)